VLPDLGVAMGIKGTEVTKEAVEMVLADDNFASITAAVKEGRTVYNNIEKAILFTVLRRLPLEAGYHPHSWYCVAQGWYCVCRPA
jgi:magnesium-transporting ATPase (P-type)